LSLAEPTSGAPPASAKPGLTAEAIYRSPAFVPGVLVAIGIALIFGNLWDRLYDLWTGKDGYYSHGFLVPFISGYIIYRWWPKIKDIPVRPNYIALVPLLAVLYITRIASMNGIYALMSIGLILILLFSAWFVAGWRWMLALSPATLYLAFALPLWTSVIDNYTNPLQIYSTKVAYIFLELCGFDLYQGSPTIINMSNFVLNVEVPCSGLKLLLALTAFTFFFILIARLRWWANLLMLTIILPLALVVNGIRIGLIGVVGELQSPAAGMAFHDYSGYITLVLCFFILFRFARWLGWKD
jgi:exosortase